MRILNKEETSRTIYYAIEAELDDGSIVEATLAAYDADSAPDYELIITDDSKVLTVEEEEKLEELAIEVNECNF